MDTAALPLGRQLKLERMARGLRQIDVAERLGVHELLISKIETGRKATTPDLVERYRAAISQP